MEVTISVTCEYEVDELRSLYTWLVGDPELRGRVRLVEQPPQPGTLGSIPDLLTVAGPGGVLATAAIAWLRNRTSDVVCTVTRKDGASVEVSAKRVRGSDLATQQRLIQELVALVQADTHDEDDATRTE